MRLLTLLLLLLLLVLQYQLWLSDGGYRKLLRMQRSVEQLQEENRTLSERNRLLAIEVEDLKEGQEAIEERARKELGLIRDGETFYMSIDD